MTDVPIGRPKWLLGGENHTELISMTAFDTIRPEDMKRIPGLFRRWELPEIFEPNRHYHMEEAGVLADGTPLLALYASEPEGADRPTSGSNEVGDETAPSRRPGIPSRTATRIRPQLLVTESELARWLATAEGGQILRYHHGVLVIDRLPVGSRLPKRDAAELDRVAKAAMAAAEAGRAYLVQRRHGDGDYSYFIVASGRPAMGAKRVAGWEAST